MPLSVKCRANSCVLSVNPFRIRAIEVQFTENVLSFSMMLLLDEETR